MKLNDLYVLNGEEISAGNLINKNIEEVCKLLSNGLESIDMGRKMRLCGNLIEKVEVKNTMSKSITNSQCQIILTKKENSKLFKANNFIAELTQHVPQKHKHPIRYYGLYSAYSSTTKGNTAKDGSLAQFGYTSWILWYA